jgi:NTP pyrophosphatase (non-canonical NTP hydrolase)
MNSSDYIQQALVTETKDYQPTQERVSSKRSVRLLHATMGLCTEAAEALDAVKKHVFYGKPLDETNLMEEIGDLFWYAAILADELGLSFEECQQRNIAKLKARYGERFNEAAAITRDLEKERATLM